MRNLANKLGENHLANPAKRICTSIRVIFHFNRYSAMQHCVITSDIALASRAPLLLIRFESSERENGVNDCRIKLVIQFHFSGAPEHLIT